MALLWLALGFAIGTYSSGWPLFKIMKKYIDRRVKELKEDYDEQIDVAEQTGWHDALRDDVAVAKAYKEIFGEPLG